MIAHVDSSVLLRLILDQPDPLSDLLRFDSRVTSFVAEIECLRGVESARSKGQLTADEAADRRRIVYAQLRRMRRLAVSPPAIRRAGEAYAPPIKSLDAIHLASNLIVHDHEAPHLVFETHDQQLGQAAAVMDFPVIGL